MGFRVKELDLRYQNGNNTEGFPLMVAEIKLLSKSPVRLAWEFMQKGLIEAGAVTVGRGFWGVV